MGWTVTETCTIVTKKRRIASSRSFNAAKTALRNLGLSVSEQELETVANEFIQELKACWDEDKSADEFKEISVASSALDEKT